jgi:hypothetical protein
MTMIIQKQEMLANNWLAYIKASLARVINARNINCIR